MADDFSANASTTGVLTVGGMVVGHIKTAGEHDWFGIQLAAGQHYTFNLDSNARDGIQDPYLELYDASGVLLVSDDDHGAGLASQISFTAINGGKYFLAASSTSSGDLGGYRLYAANTPPITLTNTIATPGAITVGGPSAFGIVEKTGNQDWFSIHLESGQGYIFLLEPTDVGGAQSPHLALYDALGKLLTSDATVRDNAASEIDYTATRTGIFYLGASNNQMQTSAVGYVLSADTAGPPPAATGTEAPLAVAFSPAVDTGGASIRPVITITFDKPVDRGNGAIHLETANGALIESFDAATSSRLSLSGTTLTINPLGVLVNSTRYSVVFESGALTDDAGNDYEQDADYYFFTSPASIAAPKTITGSSGSDAATIKGNLSNYALSHHGGVYTVLDKTGLDGVTTLSNIRSLKFSDLTVNLAVQAIAAATSYTDVQHVIELYVAFFNRMPDADGMAYWLAQKNGGQGINQIADTFYNAGVQFSSLTGFSAGMSNADFVNVIYRNVLGRPDGADQGGLDYWTTALAGGKETHGSLVSTILASAHTFKGNAEYGYVAALLDNKINVGKTMSIDWGLGYLNSENAISKGIEIAAAVTPTDTAMALSLVGVASSDFALGW